MNEINKKWVKLSGIFVPAILMIAGILKIIAGSQSKPSGYLLIIIALIAWAGFFNYSRVNKFHDRMNDFYD